MSTLKTKKILQQYHFSDRVDSEISEKFSLEKYWGSIEQLQNKVFNK